MEVSESPWPRSTVMRVGAPEEGRRLLAAMPKLYEAPIGMSRLPLILAVALAGCTRPVVPRDALASTIAGRMAGPPQSCVLTQPDGTIRAIDSRTVAYGRLPTIYINRLGGLCPGLEKTSTIIIYSSGGHYCRGDRIRALEPNSAIPGPICNLGDWVPYRRM
jgi:hypothetical protein